MTRSISHDQARRFYDRFGARQDRQGFYEDAALDALIELGNFSQAQHVFELGCGTGRFAARLLRDHLPPSARYVGVDISSTMVRLAAQRLQPYGERCAVHHSSGELEFSRYGGPFDRFVSTYVLDLLSMEDIQRCLAAAHAAMARGGLFCHAGLTAGVGPLSRASSGLWSLLHRLDPMLVGGCRPLQLVGLLPERQWQLIDRRVVVSFAIASEVVVASAR